jgi:hypothetical protein
MTSAARKITDTQTLGKYVEWHIFIVSNLCPYAPYLFRIAKVINLSVYPPFSGAASLCRPAAENRRNLKEYKRILDIVIRKMPSLRIYITNVSPMIVGYDNYYEKSLTAHACSLLILVSTISK